MILVGDCREVMAEIEPESVDAIVTDPPYELGFMGKGWDRAGVAFDPATWAACLRVLKPGGHLLAFGGTRTFHRMTVAIEDAGFEIKDCLSWLQGQGFPKHKSLLKPAWEPIILAKKRGAGMLNIDDCRIATDEQLGRLNHSTSTFNAKNTTPWVDNSTGKGRWPANVVLDPDAAEMLDAQSGERKSGGGNRAPHDIRGGRFVGAPNVRVTDRNVYVRPPDTGGASRFYYVAKASRRERNAGLPADEPCIHPTVKPIALMRWLVRLVTPPGGVVLDPFMGSGTTGCAAALEGVTFIGIEQDAEYAAIAERRIAHWTPAVLQPALPLEGAAD